MNTIARAVRYLSEPEAIRKVLDESLRTQDLETECIFVGARTVKYQRISFGSMDMGDYDRENGYTRNELSLEWVEKTLTQDKGDALMIDKMDDEESTANGIVHIGNRYMDKVAHPSVDAYRLSTIAKADCTTVVNSTFSADNVLTNILTGKARMEELKVDTKALLLFITPTAKAALKEAALKKGYWTVGHWNGDMGVEVEMFDGAKVISVPSEYFGNADVQAILLHKDAAPAMIKYQEAKYFDSIPGYGGRKAEVDLGIYHDALVYDELTRAICLFLKTTSTTKTITYAKGNEEANGTAPTQAATKVGESFTVAKNAFTLSGKTFVGWTDGHNIYREGTTYYVPNNDVTLTALWR